jgi:hypothetical protein
MASDLSALDPLVIQIDGLHMDDTLLMPGAVGVDADVPIQRCQVHEARATSLSCSIPSFTPLSAAPFGRHGN